MANRNNDLKTQSRTSPKSGSRGCLCPDNTYSKDCCDGSLQAQGIGIIQRVETYYLLGENGDRISQENEYNILIEI